MAEQLIRLSHAAKRAKGADGEQLAQVSLRAAASRGALKARKLGGIWYTTEADLAAYLKKRPHWFQPARRR